MEQEKLEQPIFYECAYFRAYPDALSEVKRGRYSCGKDHWERVGKQRGYNAVWVRAIEIDPIQYFMHYPDAKKSIDPYF